MLTKTIFFLFVLLSANCFCQKIYFGFPSKDVIDHGDMIVINLPNNTDGRFNLSVELDSLVAFINKNQELHFIISINEFLGSSEFNLLYTKSLKRSLKKILLKKIRKENFTIKAKGDTSTLSIENEKFKTIKIESRIDIYVK